MALSRVGKREIPIPRGVTVTVNGSSVRAKGPRGEREFTVLPGIRVEVDGSRLRVVQTLEGRGSKSAHGVMRTRVANIVEGVSSGFRKVLEIQGTGYRAAVNGNKLQMQLGFSHPVDFELPEGVKATAETPTRIVLEANDKQVVGQVAADIRAIRPPEPYKGKGIRYEGEQVRRKAGKTGGA
jgi:large subunit ribosomal protein L6